MPELPEVETVKRQLGKVLVGKKIKKIEVIRQKSVIGDASNLIGLKVCEVGRYGKVLVIGIGKDESEWGVLIHLKMTGQLIYEDKNHKRIAGGHPSGDFVSSLPSSHTRVVIEFVDEEKLFFNDQRMFGWIKILNFSEVIKENFIARLGKEPWDINEEEFSKILQSKKPIKVRIMDQDVIAGVGNIYANDALWEAGINPIRSANSLNRSEAGELLLSLRKILDEGIKYGGATAMDGKYLNLEGLGGTYQEHFRTYQREGEECLREGCGGKIEKLVVGGRGTFWCRECQK